MFDKELAEKFQKCISTIPLEELNKRAENAPPSGIDPVLDEHINKFINTPGAGIGIDISLLPLSVLNTLCILDNTEILENDTIKLLMDRVSEMKPLDPEFNKILNDNFLELF